MADEILIVEDDPQQSESIRDAIRRCYRGAVVEILETEYEFRRRMDRIPKEGPKPRMVICDVMLPWAYPDPDAPSAPPDVQEGTFRMAGVRCYDCFRRREDLKEIPWIYFTVLDKETIEYEKHSDERASFVQKSSSINVLLDEMRQMDEKWTETEAKTRKG